MLAFSTGSLAEADNTPDTPEINHTLCLACLERPADHDGENAAPRPAR